MNDRSYSISTTPNRREFLGTFGKSAIGGTLGAMAYFTFYAEEDKTIQLRLVRDAAHSADGDALVHIMLDGGKSEEIKEIVVNPTQITLNFKDGHSKKLSIPRYFPTDAELPDVDARTLQDRVHVILDIGENTKRDNFTVRVENPKDEKQYLKLVLEIAAASRADNAPRQFDVDVSQAESMTHLLIEDPHIAKTIVVTGIDEEKINRVSGSYQPGGRPNGDKHYPLNGAMCDMGRVKIITESAEQLQNDVILKNTHGKEHRIKEIEYLQPFGSEAPSHNGASENSRASRERDRRHLKSELMRG